MSHLINVSNELYEELTRIKKTKNASYTEVIQDLLVNRDKREKTETKEDLLAYLKILEKKYKGRPKENISENIDKLLYGG